MKFVKKIKILIRNNTILKNVYILILDPIIFVLRKIIPINDKKLLFISFGGEKYDDSPMVIYERMIQDSRYKDFSIVWALNKSSIGFEEMRELKKHCKVVNPNSISYFIHLFSSKTWITNVSVKRGLNFSSRNHVYINTWHGTPIKLIGSDSTKNKSVLIDDAIFLAQTEYEKKIYSRVFNISENNIILEGLPRNEKLIEMNLKTNIEKLKLKVGVAVDKEIILYAPTWRETDQISPFLDIEKISKKLNNDQVLLFRGHHAMNFNAQLGENVSNIINVSNYSNLNDLLIISNVLITDYSSIMVDFSMLDKPILLLLKDFEEYNKKRGLYFNVLSDFGEIVFENQSDLETYINNYEYRNYSRNIVKEKFKCINNNPTNRVLDLIYRNLKETFY